MKDITIKSWQDLMEKLCPVEQTSFGRFRSDYVFRGVGNKDWMLETSLQRSVSDVKNLEKPLLRSFKKYAEVNSIPGDSIWVQLSVAQHHGLPTRLLDWTVSPQVAIHFATSEQEHFDKDSAIWCIDTVRARKLLSPKLTNLLSKEYAFLFSVDMLKSIETMEEFDSDEKCLLFFEPPSLDGRIINQWGIMSVMSGAEYKLHEFLADHESLYHRYIIPKKLKWEIRDKLDQNNVTERMLFPGLDGLCKWLKRYYGRGPNITLPKNCD